MDNFVSQFRCQFGLQAFNAVGPEFNHSPAFDIYHVVMMRWVGGLKPGRGTVKCMALDNALRFQFGQCAINGGKRYTGVTGLNALMQFCRVRVITGPGQNLKQNQALTRHPQPGIAQGLFQVSGFF